MNKFLKIRKGNTRIAFILFEWLVIKVPNPRWDILKNSFDKEKGVLHFLQKVINTLYFAFLQGVIANISEGLVCYKVKCIRKDFGKSPTPKFIAKVISFGLFNLQRYAGEIKPTEIEIDQFYKDLDPEITEILKKVSLHCRSELNWRKTPEGLKLIDYAISIESAPWYRFVTKLEFQAITRGD